MANSPRRTLFKIPPRMRDRKMCSSASLMAPFRPSSRRSLNCPGSYTPSSSRISVLVKAHSSINRCQSVELRANRETSSPKTIPARPMLTSVTSFWKPSRSDADAPDCPRSLSITTICCASHPKAAARSRIAYCRFVLSVFSKTCRRVDCRTYRYALRARCSGRTFSYLSLSTGTPFRLGHEHTGPHGYDLLKSLIRLESSLMGSGRHGSHLFLPSGFHPRPHPPAHHHIASDTDG